MSEKVEIEKSQLDEILEQNRQLLANQQTRDEQINALLAERDPNHKSILNNDDEDKRMSVRVCFVDNKAVVGFANRGSESRPTYIYERAHPNDPNKRIAYVDLVLEGETDPVTVDYVEFLREADSRELMVTDVKSEPWKVEQGVVSKKVWNGETMLETDQRVKVVAKGEKRTFLVERPGGGEPIAIAEDYVNMR